jgi:3-hydroxyisobutyrate dehydrogenase-like beta-hydroxyacid dehydrogenase
MVVGFIGLGRIGRPMAERVLAAGHRLFVNDVDERASAPLIADGATACATPAEIAEACEVVVTCVPGPTEIEAVFGAPDGLLAALQAGTLVIDTSTIGAEQCRALEARCAERGAAFVDAPVSGGFAAAAGGTLTVMCGGEPAAFARAAPLLAAFATHVVHLGPSGSGAIAKAINQIIYLSYAAVYCESVALGKRAGLDVSALLEVLRTSVAGHPLELTHWDEHIERNDLAPGFQLARVLKDLDVCAATAAAYAQPVPILDAVLDAFRETAGRGFADADMTALYALRAGLTELS